VSADLGKVFAVYICNFPYFDVLCNSSFGCKYVYKIIVLADLTALEREQIQ